MLKFRQKYLQTACAIDLIVNKIRKRPCLNAGIGEQEHRDGRIHNNPWIG